MNRLLILALPLMLASGALGAVDLETVYQQSLSADPSMRQAEALHLATRETRTQAILGMLPLDTNVSKTWNGRNSQNLATPILGNLAVQVNLFSWDNWIALKAADHTVAQGEANYLAAQQDLISRVAQQYFAVLAAKDTLAAQESNLQSVARQLEQAERRFEVGLIAVTDVQIARAARDSGAAAVIAAKRAVANAEEQLRAITGDEIPDAGRASGLDAAADAGSGQRGFLGDHGAEPELGPDRQPHEFGNHARQLPHGDRRASAADQRDRYPFVEPRRPEQCRDRHPPARERCHRQHARLHQYPGHHLVGGHHGADLQRRCHAVEGAPGPLSVGRRQGRL